MHLLSLIKNNQSTTMLNDSDITLKQVFKPVNIMKTFYILQCSQDLIPKRISKFKQGTLHKNSCGMKSEFFFLGV